MMSTNVAAGSNRPAVPSASTLGHTVSFPCPLSCESTERSLQWGPAGTPRSTHKPCTLAVPVPHQEGTSQAPAIARWYPAPNATSTTTGCTCQVQVLFAAVIAAAAKDRQCVTVRVAGAGGEQENRVTRRWKKRRVHDGTSGLSQQGLEPSGHGHPAWLQGHVGGRVQQGWLPGRVAHTPAKEGQS